jgi:hypothetical protein
VHRSKIDRQCPSWVLRKASGQETNGIAANCLCFEPAAHLLAARISKWVEGTLTASFEKGGKKVNRRLNPDSVYVAPDGSELRPARRLGNAQTLIRGVSYSPSGPFLFGSATYLYVGLLAFCFASPVSICAFMNSCNSRET